MLLPNFEVQYCTKSGERESRLFHEEPETHHLYFNDFNQQYSSAFGYIFVMHSALPRPPATGQECSTC